ncbi:hypothetical protein ACV30S_13410 [Clostridium perfringens]|uniref:hypothetical protein n=1 Tax=Clostridium perfringens TaxID=1502 RepID=UPI0032DAC233
MATRKDYTDRAGQAKLMTKRGFRLTEEENDKLNELLKVTKLTLRDLITELIEDRYMEEKKHA